MVFRTFDLEKFTLIPTNVIKQLILWFSSLGEFIEIIVSKESFNECIIRCCAKYVVLVRWVSRSLFYRTIGRTQLDTQFPERSIGEKGNSKVFSSFSRSRFIGFLSTLKKLKNIVHLDEPITSENITQRIIVACLNYDRMIGTAWCKVFGLIFLCSTSILEKILATFKKYRWSQILVKK